MVENNGCTDGVPEVLDVEIGPLPTSVITGPIAVASGETGVSYSVEAIPGYTYNWTVSPEGNIAAGQGTNAVLVDWSSAGSATVSVVGSNGCGDATQVDLFVDVYDVFVSATSGDWAVGGTWVGGVAPSASSSARIAPGHTVSVYINTSVNNLTIDNGAILDSRDVYFTVNGNYTLNGTHTGSAGDRVRLAGPDAVIDGIGTYSHAGRLYIITGNKTIAAGANLTLTGSMVLGNNLIVTNYGSIEIGNDINCNPNSTWINAENSTLILQDDFTSGILITSSLNNTMVYDGSVNNAIRRPQNDTYHHLEIRGSGSKTMPSALTILGDLTMSGPLVSNNFNINLGGNWTNTASFSEGTATVILDGSGDQQLSNPVGETFYNLTISKSTGQLNLDNDVTVSNALTMTEGVISAGSNTFTLGTGTANVGSLNHASGRIIGRFKRWIDVAGGWLYPVGTANYYRPASITFNNVTGGSVTTEFISSDPGNNGLPLDDGGQSVVNTFNEGYWSMLRGDALTTTDYDLLLTANGFTSFTPTDETRLLQRPNSGSNWVVEGTHVPLAGNQVSRSGIASLSAEFALGDTTNCTPPSTSAITGPTVVCTGSFNQVYSVINTGGSTYTWTVTGGSITAGQGSNSILVTWGGTGMSAQVEVIENNGCTDGAPVMLNVDLGPLPTSSITGDNAVAIGTTGSIYSVLGEPWLYLYLEHLCWRYHTVRAGD